MFTVTDRQLAEIALETRWVTLEKLKRIVPECRASQKPLAMGLRNAGLNDEQITFLQACVLQLPFARPDRIHITPRVQKAIPVETQQRYRVAPLRTDPGANGDTIYAAMLPEVAAELASHLSNQLGVTVIPVAASAQSIGIAVSRNAKGITDSGADYPSSHELDLDTPAMPSEFAFGAAEGERAIPNPPIETSHTQITTLADF